MQRHPDRNNHLIASDSLCTTAKQYNHPNTAENILPLLLCEHNLRLHEAGGSFCTRHRVFWETRLFFHFRFPCVARSHVSCSLENCAMVYTIKNYYMNDFGFVSKFVFILWSTFVLLLSLVIVCVCGRKECVCACASSILLAFMPVYLFERERNGGGRNIQLVFLFPSLSPPSRSCISTSG